MKKYILLLITLYISACSNLQNVTDGQIAVKQAESKQVCKRVSVHKNIIKRCRPVIAG
jgi:hypothetical protein